MSVTHGQGDSTLDALGDPTRRRVFGLLRHGARPVVELARELPVSRPAVSQHLRVLKDAGLVTDRVDGRRRLYQVDPNGLETLRRYVESFWEDVLEAFARTATEVDRGSRAGATPSGRST